MDRMELGDPGSGCEDEICGLAASFAEDCINQECPVFGMIELVCVTVIYIPLMLFGLLGNILTILVVWLCPQMRSSTYLYLSSMAVSDLLILLLMPLDLYKIWRPRPWPLGDLACKLSMFLSECCTFCTILHITFLSLERYLAVCWPITAKTLVTRRRTRVLIGCLWLGAAISAAPVLIMVGVEEVGGKENGIREWREDKGWTNREGEEGRFIVGEGKSGSAHLTSTNGELEVIKWDENETKGWSERVGDLIEKGERIAKIVEEIKQENGRERQDEKEGDEYGGKEEGKTQVGGKKQNKMKEDEGGGMGGDIYGNLQGEIDRRECRCSDYAATSGLLSAMTILSNMYFLIPFCILGLVYSLIGRTLWLRPQSSRKDQSHRHTVKMLGVIVLAFVLCWLPYHVGRTIFSFSFSAYTQEVYMDTHSHSDVSMFSDNTDGDVSTYSVTDPISHARADTHAETLSRAERLTAHALAAACDTCAKTGSKVNTNDNLDSDTENHANMDTSDDERSYSNIVSRTGANTLRLDARIEAGTRAPAHTQTHNDPPHETQVGKHTGDETNATLRDKQSRPPIYASWTHEPATGRHAKPTDVNGDTRYNNTYTHPDGNAYFYYYLSQYFNLVSSVLFYLSAAVNPLLYNLMSARYRHAVHGLVHKRSLTPSHRRTTITVRHSTTTL